MDRPSIYRGFYHSQRLHLISSESISKAVDLSIVLDQTLTVVLQPSRQRTSMSHSTDKKLQPSWSLSSIFGRKVGGKCALAKFSNVYLQLQIGLVSELENLQKKFEMRTLESVSSEDFRSNPGFELSVKPEGMLKEAKSSLGEKSSVLYVFPVEKFGDFGPFDLGFTWKVPVDWSCPQPPLHATRFLMGSGNERGAIAISLKSTEFSEQFMCGSVIDDRCEFQVNIFQVVPWYIKVYYHTPRVFVDEQPQEVLDTVEKMHVSPSEDKVSPGVTEMALKFPCGMKSAAITIEFDKGFLHIDEYPPDANQGFDIPSALISFTNFHANMQFGEDNTLYRSPLLNKLEENLPISSYLEVLLVPLTPDFSMPCNVITITCNVFALFFGSLLNVLRRRVDEEERFLKSKAAKKTSRLSGLLSKLLAKVRGRPLDTPESDSTSSSFISSKLILKVMLVAGLAVFWQYQSG